MKEIAFIFSCTGLTALPRYFVFNRRSPVIEAASNVKLVAMQQFEDPSEFYELSRKIDRANCKNARLESKGNLVAFKPRPASQ